MTPSIAYILYGLFAMGGVALFLAMPKASGSNRKAGLVVGVGAIAGLLALLGTHYIASGDVASGSSSGGSNVFFYLFAGGALLAAGRVVTHPAPTYSAVYFALVVLCVAVLLVMQGAEFLAAALVIIYAGAILVTYMFVIMLAQQSGAPGTDLRAREPLVAIVVSFVLMGTIAGNVGALRAAPKSDAASSMGVGSTGVGSMGAGAVVAESALSGAEMEALPAPLPEGFSEGHTVTLGRRMFRDYVVAVQLGGLLLLVAMVGAIAISRKRVPIDVPGSPPPELGRIGREVPPF